MKSQVSDTKNQIRSLGDVNVNAIEDYKSVSERYEVLKTQHDDLIESEEKLTKIIAELDEEMRKQFSEKFQEIKSQFDKVFPQNCLVAEKVHWNWWKMRMCLPQVFVSLRSHPEKNYRT